MKNIFISSTVAFLAAIALIDAGAQWLALLPFAVDIVSYVSGLRDGEGS